MTINKILGLTAFSHKISSINNYSKRGNLFVENITARFRLKKIDRLLSYYLSFRMFLIQTDRIITLINSAKDVFLWNDSFAS